MQRKHRKTSKKRARVKIRIQILNQLFNSISLTQLINNYKKRKDKTMDSVRMMIISKTRTNNAALDAIVTSVLLALLTYVCNNYEYYYAFIMREIQQYRSNYEVNIIGTRFLLMENGPRIKTHYTEDFRALMYFFSKQTKSNKYITCLVQYYSEDGNDEHEQYMINQSKKIIVDQDLTIYGKVNFRKYTQPIGSKDIGNGNTMEEITISISSNQSMNIIREWIDIQCKTYMNIRKNSRNLKIFIYTLQLIYQNDHHRTFLWCEREFQCNRSFNNMFFDKKADILTRIDHFLNNEKWYINMGIPYTLGIGLHGPPGTGKTSFIKSLAKHTKRHIINFSLKSIHTNEELTKFFYEATYDPLNIRNSIGFDKKIIVIEDIDCLGDIVKDREQLLLKSSTEGRILQKEGDDAGDKKKVRESDKKTITLDDILNLWDGISETPGRIIVISSNYYDQLDTALVRPGRIDLTIELKNASYIVIRDMIRHFYDISIDDVILHQIKEYQVSPAIIINLYQFHVHDYTTFIEQLIALSWK